MVGTPNPAAVQELRTYNPPSQRPQESTSQQLHRPSPREDVYERFRTSLGQLSEQERKQLRSDLQTRLNAARARGLTEEVGHYERLLGIAESVR